MTARSARIGATALLAAAMARGFSPGATAAPSDATQCHGQAGTPSSVCSMANTIGNLSGNNQHGDNNGHGNIPVKTAAQLELTLSRLNPGGTIKLAKGIYVDDSSSDGVLKNSTISHKGLVKSGFYRRGFGLHLWVDRVLAR